MAGKKGLLGCSFPFISILAVVLLGLFGVGIIGGALGRSLFGELGLDFLAVPQPHPELPPDTVFYLFGNHNIPITNSIISAWITIVFLVGLSYIITRRIKLIPGRLQAAFEFLLGWLYDFCQSVAGEKNGRTFFPIVATLFLFVAFNAWLSLIPGFGSIEIVNPEGEHVHLLRGANTDINLPLALALVSFIIVEFFGFRALGIRYIGKFLNVGQLFRAFGQLFRGRLKSGLSGLFTGAINVFVGLLEGLSELIRIVSLTFRLFGNMTAGEILLLITAFLIPWLFALPFYGLELLVGFLQAMIFAGLTLVYLTMATAAHGEESH